MRKIALLGRAPGRRRRRRAFDKFKISETEISDIMHGTAMISVRTEDGNFGGQQRAAQFEITVKQLPVNISPDEIRLKPGEPQDFNVTVTDSEHPKMIELDTSHSIQGTLDGITYIGDGLTSSPTRPLSPPRLRPCTLPKARPILPSRSRGRSDFLPVEEFLSLLTANDAVYAPTLVVGRNWSRALASAALGVPYEIDDPGGCVDPETRAKLAAAGELRSFVPDPLRSSRTVYRRLEGAGASTPILAENLMRVHESGATVVVATDAGNPLTLHRPSIHEEMEALEILVAATRNGATAMGRPGEIGTPEAGRIADLLVLDEDPTADVRAFRSPTHVMRAGVLRTRKELSWYPEGG